MSPVPDASSARGSVAHTPPVTYPTSVLLPHPFGWPRFGQHLGFSSTITTSLDVTILLLDWSDICIHFSCILMFQPLCFPISPELSANPPVRLASE